MYDMSVWPVSPHYFVHIHNKETHQSADGVLHTVNWHSCLKAVKEKNISVRSCENHSMFMFNFQVQHKHFTSSITGHQTIFPNP